MVSQNYKITIQFYFVLPVLMLYFDLDLVGHHDIYSEDNNWRDLVLFYEFFHPETGRGCGARYIKIIYHNNIIQNYSSLG